MVKVNIINFLEGKLLYNMENPIKRRKTSNKNLKELINLLNSTNFIKTTEIPFNDSLYYIPHGENNKSTIYYNDKFEQLDITSKSLKTTAEILLYFLTSSTGTETIKSHLWLALDHLRLVNLDLTYAQAKRGQIYNNITKDEKLMSILNSTNIIYSNEKILYYNDFQILYGDKYISNYISLSKYKCEFEDGIITPYYKYNTSITSGCGILLYEKYNDSPYQSGSPLDLSYNDYKIKMEIINEIYSKKKDKTPGTKYLYLDSNLNKIKSINAQKELKEQFDLIAALL